MSDVLLDLTALLREAASLTLSPADEAQAARRLAPRLQRLGLDDFDTYLALLDRERGTELQLAVSLLTTQDARFFREPELFDWLEAELSRARPARLRLWSAAASFGDEAYSLAMVLHDLQRSGRIGADWSVLGTDVGEHRLRVAAAALYPAARLRGVAPERLRQYTLRGAGPHSLVQMHAGLRERVRFMRHDLRQRLATPETFDVILLRDALVYFDAPTRQRVLRQVLSRLQPGGLLVVGAAQAGLVGVAGLAPVPLAPGVFRGQTNCSGARNT
jgi:chemotaxis protein methyltransferase CheR